ncbi:MAG: DUF998 domain-containing protein [Pseudomonadota bacterium]
MQSSASRTENKQQGFVPQLVILTLFWVGLQLVASWVKPGFDHMAQYISEINATGTPNAGVLGWVGFIPLAMVAFSLLVSVRGQLRVQGLSHLGWLLLFLWPLGYLLSALAPCDAGCPADGSSSQAIHNVVAVLSYFGFALGTLLLALTPKTAWPVRTALVLLSVIVALGFLLMNEQPMAEIRGAIQRYTELAQLAVFWLLLWLTDKSVEGADS